MISLENGFQTFLFYTILKSGIQTSFLGMIEILMNGDSDPTIIDTGDLS